MLLYIYLYTINVISCCVCVCFSGLVVIPGLHSFYFRYNLGSRDYSLIYDRPVLDLFSHLTVAMGVAIPPVLPLNVSIKRFHRVCM